jgi:hypothetical protein
MLTVLNVLLAGTAKNHEARKPPRRSGYYICRYTYKCTVLSFFSVRLPNKHSVQPINDKVECSVAGGQSRNGACCLTFTVSALPNQPNQQGCQPHNQRQRNANAHQTSLTEPHSRPVIDPVVRSFLRVRDPTPPTWCFHAERMADHSLPGRACRDSLFQGWDAQTKFHLGCIVIQKATLWGFGDRQTGEERLRRRNIGVASRTLIGYVARNPHNKTHHETHSHRDATRKRVQTLR